MKKFAANVIKFIRERITQILFWVILTAGILYLFLKMLEVSKIDSNLPTVAVSIFTLILAGATMNLATQTARSNKQNRERENRDRKERLLNEITEWAENVYTCGIETKHESWRNIAARYLSKINVTEKDINNEIKLEDFIDKSELYSSFLIIKREGHYINKISLIFGQDIQKAVMKLQDALEKHVELLDRRQRTFIEPVKENTSEEKKHKQDSLDEVFAIINTNKDEIHSLACIVIEEATKIKIQNISEIVK